MKTQKQYEDVILALYMKNEKTNKELDESTRELNLAKEKMFELISMINELRSESETKLLVRDFNFLKAYCLDLIDKLSDFLPGYKERQLYLSEDWVSFNDLDPRAINEQIIVSKSILENQRKLMTENQELKLKLEKAKKKNNKNKLNVEKVIVQNNKLLKLKNNPIVIALPPGAIKFYEKDMFAVRMEDEIVLLIDKSDMEVSRLKDKIFILEDNKNLKQMLLNYNPKKFDWTDKAAEKMFIDQYNRLQNQADIINDLKLKIHDNKNLDNKYKEIKLAYYQLQAINDELKSDITKLSNEVRNFQKLQDFLIEDISSKNKKELSQNFEKRLTKMKEAYDKELEQVSKKTISIKEKMKYEATIEKLSKENELLKKEIESKEQKISMEKGDILSFVGETVYKISNNLPIITPGQPLFKPVFETIIKNSKNLSSSSLKYQKEIEDLNYINREKDNKINDLSRTILPLIIKVETYEQNIFTFKEQFMDLENKLNKTEKKL